MAGSAVRLASTVSRTARTPPMPMERTKAMGGRIRPAMAMATVRPLKATLRPAVWTVRSAARRGSGVRVSSSRKRLTISRA